MNDATIHCRVVAREQARVVAGLVVEEIGRVPSEAQAAFWDELVKMLPIPRPVPVPARKPEPLTNRQSRAFGHSLISFGKYAGSSVDQIPVDYLEHLCEPKPFIEMLKRYLASQRVQAEDLEG